MRRLLLMVATVAAATLLFVPGAVAGEPDDDRDVEESDSEKDREQDEPAENEQDQKEERREKRERPAKPRIKCDGSFTFGTAPKVTCEWTAEHPDANAYKVVRRGGGERRVFRGDQLDHNTLVDHDVKYGTRYRYRVVVLDDSGKRLQRSHWTKAIKRRGRVERLELSCDVHHGEEAGESNEGGGDDLAEERVEGSGTSEEEGTRETGNDEEGGEGGSLEEQLDGLAVVCEWDDLTRDGGANFELWRKIKGERKELVTHLELDQLRCVDELPAGTSKVKYAVRAVNEDGRRVGHSKIDWVRFGDAHQLPADEV